MNKKIASMTVSTKEFWTRNKGKIAVAATATTVGMALIMKAQRNTVNGFLDEHGLKDEFLAYLIEDEEVEA